MVGAGIDTLWTPSLPRDVGVMLAIRIVGLQQEFVNDQEHVLRIETLDPSMNPVGKTLEAPFTANIGPDALPGFEIGRIVVVRAQWHARDEGCYTINPSVDGQGCTLPISIRAGQPSSN